MTGPTELTDDDTGESHGGDQGSILSSNERLRVDVSLENGINGSNSRIRVSIISPVHSDSISDSPIREQGCSACKDPMINQRQPSSRRASRAYVPTLLKPNFFSMAFSSRASFPVVGSRSIFFPLVQGSFMMS